MIFCSNSIYNAALMLIVIAVEERTTSVPLYIVGSQNIMELTYTEILRNRTPMKIIETIAS